MATDNDGDLAELPHLKLPPRAYSTAELAELGELEVELSGAWLELESARDYGSSIDNMLTAADRVGRAAAAYSGAVIRMTLPSH